MNYLELMDGFSDRGTKPKNICSAVKYNHKIYNRKLTDKERSIWNIIKSRKHPIVFVKDSADVYMLPKWLLLRKNAQIISFSKLKWYGYPYVVLYLHSESKRNPIKFLELCKKTIELYCNKFGEDLSEILEPPIILAYSSTETPEEYFAKIKTKIPDGVINYIED